MNWNKSVNPYYCPNCGQGYTANQCSPEKRKSFSTVQPSCPVCNIMLKNSGSSLIKIGIIAIILGSIIMCWEANLIGLIIGTTLIVIGIIRVIDRILTKKKFLQKQNDNKKE